MSDTLTPQPSVEPAPATPPGAPVGPEPAGGFLQNLVDLYFAPRDAFARIVANPRWVLPFLATLAITMAFVLYWMSRVDATEFARDMLEQSPFWDRVPADQRGAMIEQTAGRMKYGWINALVVSVVWFVVSSAVLMFIFRFFYAGAVTFKRALAIVAWTSLAVALVTTPLTLGVMALKGDWNLNPQDVLHANPSLFLDKETVAKPLWALVTSLDLFSFWQIFLLATGFAVASRKTTGSAIWGVLMPWALIVLVKIGWTAMMG